MAKQIGSQRRETLEESGYTLVEKLPNGEVVLLSDTGQQELWFAHDDHAGLTIEIEGVGYEFIATVTAAEVMGLRDTE